MKTPSAAIAAILLLASCTTAQTSRTPQATVVASASSSAASGQVLPFEDQERGHALSPGSYVLHYASIGGAQAFPTLAITFTVPAGWDRVQVDGVLWNDSGMRLGFAVVDNLYVDPCDPDRGLREPAIGPSVDDLTRALATVPGWEVVDEVREDEFFGFAGSRVELIGPADISSCTDEASRLFHALGTPGYVPAISDSEHHEILILNVHGTRLVIDAVATNDASAMDLEEMRAVIESIVIEA